MGKCLQLISTAIVAACSAAHAANVVSTWTGGTGNWSDATKWDTNPTIPDNGGGNSYSVQIDGGITGTASVVTLDTSRTISGLLIDAGDSLSLGNAKTLTLAGGGTFTNNGTFNFYASAVSSLTMDANTTLSGTGVYKLNNTNSRINVNSVAARLTIDPNIAITGRGNIGGTAGGLDSTMLLTNSGTIQADGVNTISINSITSLINTGTIKATNRGVINLATSTIDNTGGTILADGLNISFNSRINVLGTSISNGNLTTTNNGIFTVSAYGTTISSALSNVAFSGTLLLGGINYVPQVLITGGTYSGSIVQNENTVVDVSSAITLNAAWTIPNVFGGSPTAVRLAADTDFNGAGSLTIANATYQNIFATNGTSRLTLGANFTLAGAGNIGMNSSGTKNTLKFTNNGTVDANSNSAAMNFYPNGALINAGTMKATNGGILNLAGVTVTNAGGTINVDGAASSLKLEGAIINGGNLTATNGGVINISLSTVNTTFNNVNFSSGTMSATGPSSQSKSLVIAGGTVGGTIAMGQYSVFETSGTITVNGAWNFYSAGASTILLATDTTLDGNGIMTLGGTNYSIVSGKYPAAPRLTVGANFTIQGSGSLGEGIVYGPSTFLLTNNGLINATSGFLGIQPRNAQLQIVSIINTGTLKASTNSTLWLLPAVDNTGGFVIADGVNAKVTRGSFTNGTIKLLNGGTLTETYGITNAHLIIDSASSYSTAPANASFAGVENDGAFTLPANTYSLGAVTGTGATTLSTNAIAVALSLKQNSLTLHGDVTHVAGKLTITESSPTLAEQPSAPAGSDAMVSVVKSLTIDNDGAGNFFATLDLKNNDLIIDYTGGSSPLATIEAMVKSGSNSGAWNGRGITSSTAATNPNLFHLAVADNALLAGTAFNSFDGIDTSNHQQVIIKFTWVADINLDGLVDSNDAIAFATNYSEGLTGAHHQFGDLNYDGTINFNDAILFATAYNSSLPHMPEPASLALLALGGLSLLRRKS